MPIATLFSSNSDKINYIVILVKKPQRTSSWVDCNLQRRLQQLIQRFCTQSTQCTTAGDTTQTPFSDRPLVAVSHEPYPLLLPSRKASPLFGWYSLRLPTKGWPGWIDLGGRLHAEINGEKNKENDEYEKS